MIDRGKVIAALQHCATLKTCDKCPMGDGCKGHCNAAMAAAVELLKGQDIPRCKECRHWHQDADRPDVGDEFPDTGYCGLFERTYLATDFCSYHTEAYWGWADEKEGAENA